MSEQDLFEQFFGNPFGNQRQNQKQQQPPKDVPSGLGKWRDYFTRRLYYF